MKEITKETAHIILKSHGKKVSQMIQVASRVTGYIKQRIRLGDICVIREQEGFRGKVRYYVTETERELP